MKIRTITLRKILEVKIYDSVKRLLELDGLDKKALKEDYKEWTQASEGSKDQPHILYSNQIHIEQL
tara:strand:+ start:8668 stop:8865 length:198 start_codon:yes stop_codon:yes gene_type:complete